MYKTCLESGVEINYCQKQLGQRGLASTLLAAYAYSAFCFVDSASIILQGCKQSPTSPNTGFWALNTVLLTAKAEIY